MRKSILKRIISLCLAILMFASVFPLGFSQTGKIETVYADSNDRRQGFLDLMHGKTASTSEDIANLTEADLRVLGLYLSNFYIPFGTVLDGDGKEKVKEQAVSDLKDLGFDKDTASVLIDIVFEMSLSSAEQLYWSADKDVVSNDEGKIKYCFYANAEYGAATQNVYYLFKYNTKAQKPLSDDQRKILDEYSPSTYNVGMFSKVYNDVNYYFITNKDGIVQFVVKSSYSFQDVLNKMQYWEDSDAQFYETVQGTTVGSLAVPPTYNTEDEAFNDLVSYWKDYQIKILNMKEKDVDTLQKTDPNKYPYVPTVDVSIDGDGALDDYSTIESMAPQAKSNGLFIRASYDDNDEVYNPLTVFDFAGSYTGGGNTPRGLFRGTSKTPCGYLTENLLGSLYAYCCEQEGIENASSIASLTMFLVPDGEDLLTGRGGNRMYYSKDNINTSNAESVDFNKYNKKAYATSRQNMYIDCFGNILADVGSYRVIVVPACLNPCVFTDIDGDGEDKIEDFSLPTASIGSVSKTVATGSVPFYLLGNLKDFDSDKGLWFSHIGVNEIDENLRGSEFFETNADKGSNGDYKFSIPYKNGTASDKDNNFIVYESIATDFTVQDNSSFVAANFNESLSEGDLVNANKFLTDSDVYWASYTAGDKVKASILLSYAFAYCAEQGKEIHVQGADSKDATFNIKTNFGSLPTCDTSTIDWGTVMEESASNAMMEETMSLVYGFLHPTKGIKYVATWVKNKLGGVLINWHEDIVGSSDSNSTTGMTQYLGTSGYVSIPSLYDIEWMADLVESYNSIIVYVIIMFAVIMLCYILTGNLTIQRGILGLLTFSILAFLPPVAINGCVNIINSGSDIIFSKKFEYWAICQMETYLNQLNTLNNATTTQDYISSLLEMDTSSNSEAISETGYSGVKLKWMSPKRYNEMAEASKEVNNLFEGTGLSSTFGGMVLNAQYTATSGESWAGSGSLYLYRDYADIYRHASVAYNLWHTYNMPDSEDMEKNVADISVASDWAVDGSDKSSGKDTQNQRIYGSLMKNSYMGKVKLSNDIKYYDLVRLTSPQQVGTGNAIKGTSAKTHIDNGFLYDTYSAHSSSKSYFSNYCTATAYLINWTKIDGTTKREEMDAPSLAAMDYRSIQKTSTINLGDDVKDNIGKRFKVWGISPSSLDLSLNNVLAMSRGAWELANSKKPATTTESTTEENNDSSSTTETTTEATTETTTSTSYEDVEKLDTVSASYFYYSLYAESPFYFFSWNIQDQFVNSAINGVTTYKYDYKDLGASKNSFKNLVLNNSQDYFYNYVENDGYGELRDFMNFHDLFYYIIPVMRQGNGVVTAFEDKFGLKTYDTCSLQVKMDGNLYYNGEQYENIEALIKAQWDNLNDQERYELWHDYNVNCIYNMYVPWLDAMEDCDYAKGDDIMVGGKKYHVADPLDPTSYFTMDSNGNLNDGRYMVFSRSEMAYYGLSDNDLTEVERRIIKVQDNVYKNSINLMNFYTFSDETLIQAFAMLELFEFNKEFSQQGLVGESYVQYPQGYELRAFTYDAYLRLIIAEASGDSLMTGGNGEANQSIYERVQKKTSLFFGMTLVINDFVATYVIPGLRLFFLVAIFILSLALIIASAVKLEMNIINVLWKSVISPLLMFGGVSLGLAFVVSLFMSNGANGVVQTSATIRLGDPTMVILVMLIINVVCTVLYFKVCKKCYQDCKKYVKAVATNIGGAVAGAASAVAGAVTSGKQYGRPKIKNVIKGGSGSGSAGSGGAGGSGGGVGENSSASSRGKGNVAKTAGAFAAGAVASDLADGAEDKKKQKYDGMSGGDIRDFDSKSALESQENAEKQAFEQYNKNYEKSASDYARANAGKGEARRDTVRDIQAKYNTSDVDSKIAELKKKGKNMTDEERDTLKGLKSERKNLRRGAKQEMKSSGVHMSDRIGAVAYEKKDEQRKQTRKRAFEALTPRKTQADFRDESARKAIQSKETAKHNALARDEQHTKAVTDAIKKQGKKTRKKVKKIVSNPVGKK